ncbi:MAG: tetratricopeptide repeat protein [Candidatus Delongbacteria bacterium]
MSPHTPRPRRSRLLRPLLWLLPALLLGSGCGAYFNTYYNADKAYRKGERLQADSGAKTARAQYDECLKISSKLLQFYPESRWVDNTILLVGQCYVRMDQQRRALRKFDELEARFPDSPLLPRARIWRARALLALENEGACLEELARLPLDDLPRADRVEALRVYADLYRGDGDRERLVETLDRLLKIARRNQDRAAIHLDMAAVQEESGQWEEALKHYNAVRRFRPLRSPLLKSWLGSLDNNLRLGRLDVVERRLRKLGKDERFYPDRHALQLREGWLRERRGQLAEARADWNAILKDVPRTESSAAASHSLAQAFLRHDGQLDSARVYFKRTATEQSGSRWADSSAVALTLVDALDRTHKEIRRLDGLISHTLAGLCPDSVRVQFAQTLLPRLRARQDSLRADSLRVLGAPDSLGTGDSLTTQQVDAALLPATPPAKSPPPRPADALGKGEPARPDSLGRPESGGRKGGSRVRLFDFQKKEREVAQADSLRRAHEADSLKRVDDELRRRRSDSLLVAAVLDTLSHWPDIDSLRLQATGDSLSRLRFDQHFYLAELQTLRMYRAPVADSLLTLLLAEPSASDEQAARLHYAYGSLRLDAFADSSGRRYLETLLRRWPLSLAANPARDRLGLPRTLSEADSAAVRLALAEELRLEGRDPLGAIRAYRQVAEDHPSTPQAATALLAAAAVAWEDLENPALANGFYRRYLRAYPQHAAADQVRRRLGQAVAEPEAAVARVEETQQVTVTEARVDESGVFVDPDAGRPLGERLQSLRERFRELGRLKLEQILE